MNEALMQAVTTAILSILGVGGLIYWMKRHIDALKGAVDAQQKTIEAQATILKDFEALNKIMKTVIETVDAPAMLKRWEDYKKIVDHEKEIALQQQATHAMDSFSNLYNVFIDLAAKTIPYTPLDQRVVLINSLNISPSVDTQVRDALHRIADSAPDQLMSGVVSALITGNLSVSQSQNRLMSEGTVQ